MDSLAQELVDAIIDRVPRQCTPSCSLVAKRWRQHSQRRYFDSVGFICEDQMILWETNIPKDPDGIPSYVRHVHIQSARSWDEPAIFSRVLKTFRSMESLTMSGAGPIPPLYDFPDSVPIGEFGSELTSLTLIGHSCTLVTIMSFILSLPNLNDLWIERVVIVSEESPSTLPDTSCRRPLKRLVLQKVPEVVVTALAQCQCTTKWLCLDTDDHDIERLIKISSEVVVTLSLQDQPRFMVHRADVPLPEVHLPPLSALTWAGIALYSNDISGRLADLLSSIHSAPALSSVSFAFPIWHAANPFPTSGPWTRVDKWLARLADKRNKAGERLAVMLSPWTKGDSNWEGYFPEFRKVGGWLMVGATTTPDRGN